MSGRRLPSWRPQRGGSCDTDILGLAQSTGPRHRPSTDPRRPTATLLYPVVQHHLEAFLAQAAETDPMGYGVPSWVERDFRAYLRCGILAHGFARARCEDCGHERLIPFSCKGRAICPSCNSRRMAEVAAHMTDHVLPHLPVRQWVLSLPKRLRPFLEGNPDLAGAVLQVFLRAIRGFSGWGGRSSGIDGTGLPQESVAVLRVASCPYTPEVVLW